MNEDRDRGAEATCFKTTPAGRKPSPRPNQPEYSSQMVNEAIMGHACDTTAFGAYSTPTSTQKGTPSSL